MRCRFLTCLALVPALAAVPPLAAQSQTFEQLQTFSYLLSQVRLNYVTPVGTEQLVRSAIEGMLRSLDPHSRFVPRSENDLWLSWQAGHVAGTGILVEDQDGILAVAAVRSGSSAAREGILPGDRLLALDDTLVSGSPAHTVQLRLLGEQGRKVRLRLARGPLVQPETLTVTVRNEVLRPRSVSDARQIQGVGYVRLEQFEDQAAKEVHDAVGRALSGLRVRRLVLDLRGNPGGEISAAVDVASQFLPKDKVVCKTTGRRQDMDRTYSTSGDGPFADVPMVVLIDRYTASAAEILAAALQDHDRATILGRRSFGKALVQRLFEVPPNGDAAWLTVGFVHTPSGRLIQRRYEGLTAEQYYALAGGGGAAQDTLTTFTTDSGRTVRGGGGIAPDSALPPRAPPPLWWSVAADSGFDHAIADSVAPTLSSNAESHWPADTTSWRERLLRPFLERVRSRLRVTADADSAQAIAMAEALADRAASVRWGADAAENFELFNDPDIRAAVAWLDRTHPAEAAARH
ncbi:MAG TPA: S41 family peptidase [Gemmatimonadales bacterium]|nr:S41 family peptidase [Gemmatimonadales bacterium]